MRIITDAKRVMILSYSFWAQVLGLAALIVPELLFGFWGVETDPYMLWWIGVGLLAFGIVGRLVVQTGSAVVNALRIIAVAVLIVLLSIVAARAEPATEAETLAVAVPLVAKWEGKRNEAYLDRIASPPVWTVCYGETRGVRRGDRYTDTQCTAMLRSGLVQYRNRLHQYYDPITVQKWLPATRDAAFVSLSWNIGTSAAGKSTAVRRLNAGDIAGACEALTWWNRAGKRVVRGLVNRRADERALCLQGEWG